MRIRCVAVALLAATTCAVDSSRNLQGPESPSDTSGPTTPPRSQRYTVREIPEAEPGAEMYPVAINGLGDVAGTYFLNNNSLTHAFLLYAQEWTVRRVLVTPDGRVASEQASAVNDARQVAGMRNNSVVRWEAGQETPLAHLAPTHAVSLAYAIAPDGTVYGASVADDGYPRAVAWAATAPLALSDGRSMAMGVSPKGLAVGSNNGRAAVFDGTSVRDLGTLGATNSLAFAASESGRVVGRTSTNSGSVHAFYYDFPNGPMVDASPRATWCELTSVNASDTAVGWCDGRAAIFRSGEVELLDALVIDPGWLLIDASAINEAGAIVGRGLHNGVAHAYFAEPVPH
jgi:probable HAF family extracellular repeat protein